MLIGMVPTMMVDVEDGVIIVPEVVWDMMADLDTKERWERGELIGRRTIERSLSVAERSAFYGSPRPWPRGKLFLSVV